VNNHLGAKATAIIAIAIVTHTELLRLPF